MKLEFRRRYRKRKNTNNKAVKILAYLHRNFIFLMSFLWLAIYLVFGKRTVAMPAIALTFFIYALWSFLACIFKWKHYCCSMQLLNKKKITPDDVRFEELSFFDSYGTSIIFAIAGLVVLLFSTL